MRFQKGFAHIILIVVVVLVGIGVVVTNKYYSVKIDSNQKEADKSPIVSVTTSPQIPTVKPSQTPSKTMAPTAKPIKTITPVPLPTMHQITVSGFAYEDRNDNGIIDSDDPKLPNMQIYFYDVANPNVQINTVFTDSAGNFANTIDVVKGVIVKPTTYNNFRPRGDSMTFANNYNSIQIGFRSASAPSVNLTGILEGNVYNDTNRNHARDGGESGIFFYKLYLIDSSGNYYNTVENAQTTDAGGHFKWVNLPADRSYKIKLSNPDFVIDTTEYSFTLSSANTQNTDIEIPVYNPN